MFKSLKLKILNLFSGLNKIHVKQLEPCEHVRRGEDVYAIFRVEKWVLKDDKYVMVGYAERKTCLECCNLLA